jgi:hypothetical protein
MADQWFVARGKSKEGPFSLERMRRMASQGQLLPTDMLLMAGAQKWAAASTVEGLFADQPQTDAVAEKQTEAPGKSSLQDNPVAWVQEQFRTNPQRVLLAGGGAALALLFVVCVGCVGIVSLMSGGGDHTGGDQARNRDGGSNDDGSTKKVSARSSRVTAENARKVRRGMTEGEVESLLGGPGKLTYNRSGQTNNGSTYFCKEWKGLIRGTVWVEFQSGKVSDMEVYGTLE